MLYEQPSGKGEVPVRESYEWKDGWTCMYEWKERWKGRIDGKQQVKKDDPHALVLKYTHKDNYSYNAVPDVYLFQV